MSWNFGYIGLCYHYIRQKKNIDPFPRILGNGMEDFLENIINFRKKYRIISPKEAIELSYGVLELERHGVLLSFDDGLSDHYEVAKILYKKGIKAFFAIPSCIISDKMPANPVIIHYTLADFGINKFLVAYDRALNFFEMKDVRYRILFADGSSPWEKIAKIKSVFKYELGYLESRKVLIYIYKELLAKKYDNALEIMHLSEWQIREMIEMGHSIAAHTYTHVSLAAGRMTEKESKRELIGSKSELEKKLKVRIDILTYPFGEEQDCFSAIDLVRRTKDYKMAYTIEAKLNNKHTSPFMLGRYMLSCKDNTLSLVKNLDNIVKSYENSHIYK